MRIERKWAMPSHLTFMIPPIKELLSEELTDGKWLDPFANNSTIRGLFPNLDVTTNDLNPECDADYHMLAHEFLQEFPDDSIDGIVYDPPYSVRQVMEVYNGIGLQVTQQDTQTLFYTRVKDQIQRVIKNGGKVISFGWNSGGMGMKRGLEIERILLVPHGGVKNDTIVTVEVMQK
jgi:hypothetical protein